MQELMTVGRDKDATCWIARAGFVLAAVCGLASCRPPFEPDDLALGSSAPFVVSNSLASRSSSTSVGAASVAASARAEASVVYVSLPPGSLPSGVRANIENTRTGSGIEVIISDGGFDPVAVTASEHDSLFVRVDGLTPSGTTTFGFRIPKKRPPKVVRTDPPPQKRDVPLNYKLTVVFSEPIDPATLTSASVKLRRGTTLVPGRVAFSDDQHLNATFTADAPLEPATDYVIEITDGVRDTDGDALETPVLVPFSTGPTGNSGPPGNYDYYLTVSAPMVSMARHGFGLGIVLVDLNRCKSTCFTGDVTLSVENLPDGVTARFNLPDGVTSRVDPRDGLSGHWATLLLSALSPSATAGITTVRVRGVASGLADRTVPLTLNITESPFDMTLSSSTVSIVQNVPTLTTTVTLVRNNYAGPVSFSVDGDENNIGWEFAPDVTTGNSSQLTLTGLLPGVYQCYVRASSDGFVGGVPFTLTVTPALPLPAQTYPRW